MCFRPLMRKKMTMDGLMRRGPAALALSLAALLAACGSAPSMAPVEDRAGPAPKPVPVQQTVKPAPGFENAGKPGYYTVKPGDTLMRIGLDNGQSARDIARWNALDNPNRIEVGQVLRIVPPVGEPTVVARPVTGGTVTATPIGPANSAANTAPSSTAKPAAAAPATPPVAAAPASPDDDLGWIWPSNGPILQGFDEAKNNGIDIGGAAGDSVVAVADGKVIWAGMGEGSMRNYGNLIIIQHNKTWISAYANNQNLLVKEEQRVKKGQKIAEMGNTGTDRVKLHFELRRMGRAQDPTKYLPAR